MSILIDVVITVNFVVKGQHRSIMQCHFLVLFFARKKQPMPRACAHYV
jgi:hypothetical protein